MQWRTNRFLPAFGQDVELIRPHLREVRLRAGQILCEPGERIERVYFLHDGAISKLAPFEDGSEIECALIGREGAVGILSAIGLHSSVTRDVCHLDCRALMTERGRLAEAMRASPRIHAVLDRYCAWKLSCAVRYGACNAKHSVEQRLCRWLLTCSDVLESDEIPLPQDVFANMLGVQRSSISPALQTLRARGVIALSRAKLTITDHQAVMDLSCECYATIKGLEYELLRDLGISAGEPYSSRAARPPHRTGTM